MDIKTGQPQIRGVPTVMNGLSLRNVSHGFTQNLMRQIFKNREGHVIGVLEGNVFLKRVNEKKHLLRIWDAWGIQDTALNQLPSKTIIRIIDDDGVVYETTVEDFYHYGRARTFGNYGMQMFLERKHFNRPPKTLKLL